VPFLIRWIDTFSLTHDLCSFVHFSTIIVELGPWATLIDTMRGFGHCSGSRTDEGDEELGRHNRQGSKTIESERWATSADWENGRAVRFLHVYIALENKKRRMRNFERNRMGL
jgi:hypothetical protein